MTKINILIPVHLPAWWRDLAIERYRRHASPDTCIVGTMPAAADRVGTAEEQAQVLATKGREMEERDGVDVHILDCFGDPSREWLDRTLGGAVIGVGQAGMQYAFAVYDRFAVVTSESSVIDEIRERAEAYGVASRLAAVDAVEIPAESVRDRLDEAFTRLVDRCERLPGDVQGIVLGCTELAEFAAPLEERLGRSPGRRREVVNPIAAAIRWAETLVAVRRASSVHAE